MTVARGVRMRAVARATFSVLIRLCWRDVFKDIFVKIFSDYHHFNFIELSLDVILAVTAEVVRSPR